MVSYAGTAQRIDSRPGFWTRERSIAALCVLLALFSFRVGAQFLQLVTDVSWLPAFESWHSDFLPYPILLLCQFTIIGTCSAIIVNLANRAYRAEFQRGVLLCVAGKLYLFTMAFRLVVGLTLLRAHPWFGSTLPAIFHIILASFVLVLGSYERSAGSGQPQAFRWHFSRALSSAWYPAVMATVFLLYFAFSSYGMSILWASYLTVIVAAILIALLENLFPHRSAWTPTRDNLLQDTLYMALVQGVLPLGLGFLAIIILSDASEIKVAIWPHHWAVAAQAVLMLLFADLFRYWLHRAAHRWGPLWALHAVHHSPRKLYWLNVGRFHPLEKPLQFVLDTFPFVLLGVDPEVTSLYFVFYACNGFFQHANINVRLGWLNYLVSGPELHRWHHSSDKGKANCNFGNNLIIWDLLFGTWFLPTGEQVKSTGLANRQYPESFLAQLRAPLVQGLDKTRLPLPSMRELSINLLLKVQFMLILIRKGTAYRRAVKYPAAAQKRVLASIIENNISTRFGHLHQFTEVCTYDDYIKRVPVRTWDELCELTATGNGLRNDLTAEAPEFYQLTSGTTGPTKYLPLLKSGMKADQELQTLNVRSYYQQCPEAFTGRILAIVSPAVESFTPSGIPCGSASGMIYRNMPAMARTKYVLPYSTFQIKNYHSRNLVIALIAMSDPTVTIAVTANPSTFVLLRDVINNHFDELANTLESGILDLPDLTREQRRDVEAKIIRKRARANQLRSIRKTVGNLDYADIWPDLKLLNTWTGGSCGIALSSLKAGLPRDTKILDLGYIASEVRATISLDKTPGVPCLRNSFFEFVERERWDSGDKMAQLLHQLKQGKQYYVIVTTINGLYRYFMNDIVEVTGMHQGTPTLRFLQKGRGVTNITGEKLYECQTLQAIKELESDTGVAVRFHQWLADEEKSLYRLYIEADDVPNSVATGFAQLVDERLKLLNREYADKRNSGRLSPPIVRLLKTGTSQAYRAHFVEQGQREAQFKVLTLIYARECAFPLESHVMDVGT